MKTNILRSLAISLVVLATAFFNTLIAQVDTTQVAAPDTTIQEKGKEEKKDDRKRKDEFIAYAGVNFNLLSVSSEVYESATMVGYHLGGAYKRGKFFYWQVGARFNNAVYNIRDLAIPSDSANSEDHVFAVRGIDIPITGGINFLSALNRIFALRLFVSADPAINFGVGDNDLGITKDDINSFIIYGQAGLGFNVAFFLLEAGYNYGFQDLHKDHESKPGQVFINLGFRF